MRFVIAVLAGLAVLYAGGAEARPHRHHHRHHHHVVLDGVIGGRPAGCPSAYCGCGASLFLFGKIIPALNLAANWLHFKETAPAPLKAAARRGHVFVLLRHRDGDPPHVWIVRDYNSGRHLTREHARSIIGFKVVDPHG